MAKKKLTQKQREAKAEALDVESGPINIVAEKPKDIPVELVGIKYVVHAPKSSLAMSMAKDARRTGKSADPAKITKTLDLWIKVAFGKDAKLIQKRLKDPDDLLDINHVAELMSAVMEVGAKNLSTS